MTLNPRKRPKYLHATFHILVDVFDTIEAGLIRVGGRWRDEPIDNVSLAGLDATGEVTARIEPRVLSIDAFETFIADRTAAGWSQTWDAARVVYYEAARCPS